MQVEIHRKAITNNERISQRMEGMNKNIVVKQYVENRRHSSQYVVTIEASKMLRMGY